MNYKYYTYVGLVAIFYALCIAVMIGYKIDKSYIRILSNVIQVGVGLFLFVRFFPYGGAAGPGGRSRRLCLEPGDEAIIFGCAMFLLSNVGFTEYVLRVVENDVGISLPFQVPSLAAAAA